MRMCTLMLVAAALISQSVRAEDLTVLYKAKCQVCHGEDGKGHTPMGGKLAVRSFRSPEILKLPDAVLIQCITKGRNKMPAYDKQLTPEQIEGLVKYLRALK
ncbi:MAG TPA: cytochrome c [Holophagaceae bacterium]|nr:cytochrome c [Holophagaceae bacterium]